MRRSPLAAVALLLLAAGPALAQFPVQVQPLPFAPYVPPGNAVARGGRDAVNSVIPDRRMLAGASFFNTEAERVFNRFHGRYIVLQAPPEPLPPPLPEIDFTRAVVTLEVAETAEVWVEDQKLKQPGRSRQFVSPELEAGASYRYTIKVRWSERGKEQERKIQVPVQAGDRPTVIVMTRG